MSQITLSLFCRPATHYLTHSCEIIGSPYPFLKMSIKIPPTVSDQWLLIPYYRFFFWWIIHLCNPFQFSPHVWCCKHACIFMLYNLSIRNSYFHKTCRFFSLCYCSCSQAQAFTFSNASLTSSGTFSIFPS